MLSTERTSMIELLLARHGETDFNLQGRYAGSSDVPLNETGRIQAGELARHPALGRAEVIVSSPLLRALETAREAQRATGLTPHVARGFAERCVGVYEGLTRAEAQARYPETWARGGNPADPDFAPEGGETLGEFTLRIARALNDLREEYDGKTVLLVAHAFVAKEINRQVYGLPYERMREFSLENGEIKELVVK